MMNCVANGHEIVALANLKPSAVSGQDELDSYMYQTVGHDAIDLYSECMALPLYRREISGSSVSQGADYQLTQDDEVEDLLELLKDVQHEQFDAHICGEGGEFETFTLDCPIFVKRIVIDKMELVIHSDDAVAVVAYMKITKAHTEDKGSNEVHMSAEVCRRLLANPMSDTIEDQPRDQT
ncbi:ATP binding domain 4, partial [Thoreauomyces humboldtii]